MDARHDGSGGFDDFPSSVMGCSLCGRLGTGAVGEVWLAEDASGRRVALKRIPMQSRAGHAVHERELVALRLLADRLGEQRGLIRILHVGVTDAELWYTMELADLVGTPPETLSLEREIGRRVRFDPTDALAVVEQLVMALKELHDAGVVHRDIKPTNILSVGGIWKLGDIGLLAEERTELTAVGTPDFMPPWGPIDRRADLYAMGRVLHCMVTGLPARSFPTLPPELLVPDARRVTKILNSLVTRACDPDPERRFQSATDFGEAVVRTRRDIEMAGTLLTRRRMLSIGSGALATAGAAMLAWPPVRHALRSAPEPVSLFDGKTLDGWVCDRPGHHGIWFVRDGAIRCERDESFKLLNSTGEFRFGRLRAMVSPDHQMARLALLYGEPRGHQFFLMGNKYTWIRSGIQQGKAETPERWRSFPGPIPPPGEWITMEVDWGPDRTQLFVEGVLLSEVPGLDKEGTIALHVWGKGEAGEIGDSGGFREITFQSRA